MQEILSVPAILVFGDSYADTGNNNYIDTMFKANFLPYGKDFMGGVPTGRFSNGKIISDVFGTSLFFDIFFGHKVVLIDYFEVGIVETN
uniref:SGNH hydrolase-type esterase domain-containing protein n=1 Tax=Lactuca sativa TaxID=4236 RepID=A0A9R1WEH5_LACSA|nr:hypothetical protein LSAT_V11C200052890 [Lactuca sativa]